MHVAEALAKICLSLRQPVQSSPPWLDIAQSEVLMMKALMMTLALTASAQVMAEIDDVNYQASGHASWYGPGFHGRRTASGERFDRHAYTAAHKTLPLNSYVRVTNLENNESVIVKINDRGPHVRGRLIDLSQAAAKALRFRGGSARVEVVALD